jgi:hypothetical protein
MLLLVVKGGSSVKGVLQPPRQRAFTPEAWISAAENHKGLLTAQQSVAFAFPRDELDSGPDGERAGSANLGRSPPPPEPPLRDKDAALLGASEFN